MRATRSSRWALRRGQRLARSGKLDDALAAFDAARDSGDPRLVIQHALTLARAGRGDAALEVVSRATAAAPGDAVAAMFHAYLLLRLGRTMDAGSELERAAKHSPTNPTIRSLAAARDILSGCVAEGCRKLLTGPRTENLDILAWILALVEQKLFEVRGTDTGALPPEPADAAKPEAVSEPAPGLSADACAKRGRKLLEANKPKAAAKYLARAAELRPDDADVRAMLGAALFEAGEFSRAAAELAAAPQKGPLAGVAQFYRAAAAYRLERFDETLALLDTISLTGDGFFYKEWCSYVRGMTLAALGRVDEAAEHLAAFIDVEPDVVERRLTKAVQLLAEVGTCSMPS